MNSSRLLPSVHPISRPVPGVVRRYEQLSTRSRRPAMYPPVGATPPPGFLISEPAIRSAPC
jgi:hypothetical protein